MTNAEETRLLRASALVGLGSTLSRVTGLLRTVALIWALADTSLAAAYNVANNVPNIIYELVAGGVLSAALIPLFVQCLDRGDDDGVSAVVTISVAAMLLATAFTIVGAPLLASLFTSFRNSPDTASQQAAMVTLLRWFLPQVLLYGLIALFNALLNARRAFGAAAFAPAINNVVVTAMFLVLPSLTKGDLRGVSALDVVRSEPRVLFVLGAGTTLGVAVNAAVLVPALVGRRLHLRVNFDLRNPTVHRLIKLSTWTVSYAVTNQVANFVVLPIANRGNASAYLYAYLIFIVPHGLLAASLLTTITPELSRQAHAQDWGSLRRSWTGGLRATGLLVLPAAAGLTAIAYPLVRVVPVWSTDTKTSVASVLIWYAPGLFSYSVYLLALRPFYARGDTRTPFRVNLVQNAVHIVVAVILGFRFGVQGLAATHTIAYSVGAVLAFGSAAKSLGRVPISEVAPIAGMAGAAIAMGTVVAAVLALVNLGNGEAPLVLQLVLAVVLGAALYPAYLRAFRADRDLQPVMHRLAARFGIR